MPVELESGAIKHLEDQIIKAAEEELSGQHLEVSMTQHAPGDTGLGIESAIIEVSADVDDTDLQNDLMEYAYEEFVGKPGNLVFQAIRRAHERLQSYGSGHSYDVENVENSFTGADVQRSNDTITIGFGWEHRAAAFFERGTSDHTIHGDPVLSWIEENPTPEMREKFESEGGGVRVFTAESNPSGIPESRFIRHGLNWLETEVASS